MQPLRDAKSIPGPKGQFLIGNALRFERDPIGWLRESLDEFGDIVRVNPYTIVIHDQDDVQRFLLTTNSDFVMDKPPRGRKSLEQDQKERQQGWLEENSYFWRIFSRPTVARHLDRIAQQVSAQFSYQANREQDVYAAARRVCGNTIVDFFLGHDENAGDIASAADRAMDAHLQINERPESRWLFGSRKRSRHIYAESDRQMEAVRHIIARRTAGDAPGEQHDALGTLLSDFPELTESVVATIIGDGISTGFSAPGSALTWIMLRLANHPDHAEHIRREAEGFDLENMTPGDINRIVSSYAAAFVKEVLRLHPPHWMIIRRTASRVLIQGYQIPPGHIVLCIPYLIHRDRRWWSEPEAFDPERWRGKRAPYSGNAYLPFGHGPRTCPARFIGQIELVLATILLAAKYTLKLPPLDAVDAHCRSLLLPESLEGGWYKAASQAPV